MNDDLLSQLADTSHALMEFADTTKNKMLNFAVANLLSTLDADMLEALRDIVVARCYDDPSDNVWHFLIEDIDSFTS